MQTASEVNGRAGADAKPHIVIIGTGGTIASSAASASELYNYDVASKVDEIIAAVPQIANMARISLIQPINIESSRIDGTVALDIARSVASAVGDPSVDAVLVTHGTDTIEETAFLLHLTVRTLKPIVLVGSMRPASALSADGPLNLYNAVLTASNPASREMGAMVVANSQVLSARAIVKRDTAAVDALQGAKYGLIAEISGDRIEYFYRPMHRHTANSRFAVEDIKALAQVDILYDHQGAGSYLCDACIDAGSQAIIVAGMGNGSLSPDMRKGVARARESGLLVVRASRTGQGIVAPLKGDRELELLVAGSHPPQKARVLTSVALACGQGNDLQEILYTH